MTGPGPPEHPGATEPFPCVLRASCALPVLAARAARAEEVEEEAALCSVRPFPCARRASSALSVLAARAAASPARPACRDRLWHPPAPRERARRARCTTPRSRGRRRRRGGSGLSELRSLRSPSLHWSGPSPRLRLNRRRVRVDGPARNPVNPVVQRCQVLPREHDQCRLVFGGRASDHGTLERLLR